jgi:hypothetical protein
MHEHLYSEDFEAIPGKCLSALLSNLRTVVAGMAQRFAKPLIDEPIPLREDGAGSHKKGTHGMGPIIRPGSQAGEP